jgi:hypothetical protein
MGTPSVFAQVECILAHNWKPSRVSQVPETFEVGQGIEPPSKMQSQCLECYDIVLEQWPSQDGHYPVAAYQAAFGVSLALQAATLTWFAVPWLRSFYLRPSTRVLMTSWGSSLLQPRELSLRPLKVWNGKTNAVAGQRMLAGIPAFPNFSEREPINSDWSSDVRFGAHFRLKSDVTAIPKSARKTHGSSTEGPVR